MHIFIQAYQIWHIDVNSSVILFLLLCFECNLTVTAALFYKNTPETICTAVQLIKQYARENILWVLRAWVAFFHK